MNAVVCVTQAQGNRGAGKSAAKKASKGAGGNPLSGLGNSIPQVGGAPGKKEAKKAQKATSNLGDKASKTANKAASKVPKQLHLCSVRSVVARTESLSLQKAASSLLLLRCGNSLTFCNWPTSAPGSLAPQGPAYLLAVIQ